MESPPKSWKSEFQKREDVITTTRNEAAISPSLCQPKQSALLLSYVINSMNLSYLPTLCAVFQSTYISIHRLGNAAFANQEFETAIQHYTDAIRADPKNHVFFSNRRWVSSPMVDVTA